MLPGEEDACEMPRGFGNRRQLVDPAGDLIAEGRVLWRRDCLLHLTHAFPMTEAAPIETRGSADRYKFGPSGPAIPHFTQPRDWYQPAPACPAGKSSGSAPVGLRWLYSELTIA